ncbi:MAG: rhodanese-related sulfurtransferase/predicted transcriptional regulator [Candidatus Azotimanducaceae bacterium]|jgi:rhodanese-related sulfurtransferase/predicted transcriptional regulator
MGDREAKDALFDGFADVAKALGNGRRVELVDVLAQGERHVEELASEIGQSVANTSHHLQVLAAAGLVTTRRDGNRIYYQLASEDVEQLWTVLRSVARKHLDELDDLAADYLGNRTRLDEIGRDELAQRLDDGSLIIIDVRPLAEYAAGHIRGARSIPIDQLADIVGGLPTDVEIVAYCRGPYCVFADDAVRLLRRRRRSARRLQDGFPEWRTAQHPIETGLAS